MRPQTREAIEVTFALPGELRDAYRFSAGQFVTLEAELGGERVRRSYSICAAPSEGELRVAIKRVADGLFSPYAHEALRPGTEILVGLPEGRFGVPHDAAVAKHYLAVAAGSGITPILSIVRHVLETEPESRVTLVYGNRSSSSVMFREELHALKDRYLARFALAFVMSRETQDLELFAGRIDREKCDALFASWIDPSSVDVALVCGPRSMTEAVTGSLAAHGIAPDRIRTELFGSEVRPPRALTHDGASNQETIRASVMLEGRRREFTVERGKETVLEAGLRQGLDLPFSCKGGVCATCRATLLEGEVEMDVHYGLEDYEIARGLILLCQSYPVTATLAVDVDGVGH